MKKQKNVLVLITVITGLLLPQAAMAAVPTAEIAVPAAETAVEISNNQQDNIKTNISKEDAVKIIEGFEFAKGYEMSNIYLDNNGRLENPAWRMDLYTQQYSSNVSVSISANTGELLSFNSWQQQNRKNIVSITKNQAKEIADKFIAGIVKKDDKSLVYIPNRYEAYERTGGVYEIPQYNFAYAQKVNGIISSDVTSNVTVNASNGKVTSYYSTNQYMKEIKYPSTDGIKGMDELKSEYISSLKMQPVYLTTYNYDKPVISLVYIPATNLLMDAKTMENVNDYIYGVNTSTIPIDTSLIKKVESKKITESEALNIIGSSKAYIEKLTGIKFKDSQGVAIKMNGNVNEVNRNYEYSDGSNYYGLSMSINLDTGNTTAFNFYMYNRNSYEEPKEVQEKVSYQTAKKTSDELLGALFAKQHGAYYDNNKEPDNTKDYIKQQRSHNFQYIRYENGISCGNSINISINKETGRLENLYMSWNDVSYPKPDNIISEDEAKEKYINGMEFELEYYSPYIYNGGSVEKAQEILIVFKPVIDDTNKCINAFTGEVIDYSGKPLISKKSDENHWAVNSIEMLETQGVVLRNLASYDEKLSRQDAVKMLSLVTGIQGYYLDIQKNSFADVNKDHEYYRYIESAVQNNIIRATGMNFNGTQKITKEEFIIMLLDMLGYKDIIQHKELFAGANGSVTDIYISVCKALDILPVKPGLTFNEDDNITFAEAAYSLQKALKYLR